MEGIIFAFIYNYHQTLIYIYLFFRSQKFNSFVFSAVCPGMLNSHDLSFITDKLTFSDWIFLYYFARNMDRHLFRALFRGIVQKFYGNRKDLEAQSSKFLDTENEEHELLTVKR